MSAVFVAFLLAPAVASALRSEAEEFRLAENRRPADFPQRPRSALEWAGWPRAFEEWHDDHFGLRASFLRAHNLLLVLGLNSNPLPRFVIGREHWIFCPPQSIELWRGAQPFEPWELEAWRRGLEQRRDQLAQRGIDFRFVLVPSKSVIYPEFMPARIRKGGPSRLEQLYDMSGISPGILVDLRPALLGAKAMDRGDDRVYFPLGNHWTERGTLAGVGTLVSALAGEHPAVAGVDDSSARTVAAKDPGDTLAAQMYIGDILRQTGHVVEFGDAVAGRLRHEQQGANHQTSDQDDASLPRALVFHDSFGLALPTLLGRHFSHAVYCWQPELDYALIESERPDIVLQVRSDQVLVLPPPADRDPAERARRKQRFQEATRIAVRVDVAQNAPRIACYGGGSVKLRGEGASARVACATDNAADTFLLPAFEPQAGSHPLVRLEFESSVASSASLFFQVQGDQTYTRRRQLHAETHIGVNELYFELRQPDFAGRLLWRPAQEVGTFLVSALEVRLVPD